MEFYFLGLIIINGNIRCKSYQETGLKKKTLFHITWDRPFFTKSTQDWGVPYVLPGWLVVLFPPGVVYLKICNLCRKFQFIGNINATQYYVTIVRPHFQWLEFYSNVHGMAGKRYVFSAPKGWKKVTFF